MLIETCTGNENFERSSAKAFVLHQPSRDFPAPMTRHLFVLGKEQDATVTNVSTRFVEAAPGLIEDFGKWALTRFEVPEGMILKLYGQRKMGGVSGPGRHSGAAILVRLRHDAALRRICMSLTGDSRAHFTSISPLVGRFDILTGTQAYTFGVNVDRFRSQMSEANVESVFTMETLEAEQAPPVEEQTVTVQNAPGEQAVEVAVRRRHRDLDL